MSNDFVATISQLQLRQPSTDAEQDIQLSDTSSELDLNLTTANGNAARESAHIEL